MLAMARVGLCAPIVTIITAFTNLFGRGGAPLATIVMEEEKYQKAEHYLVTTFISLIGTSCMLTLIVSIFKKEILLVLGASEATLPTRLTIFRSIFWEHFLFSLRWHERLYHSTRICEGSERSWKPLICKENSSIWQTPFQKTHARSLSHILEKHRFIKR